MSRTLRSSLNSLLTSTPLSPLRDFSYQSTWEDTQSRGSLRGANGSCYLETDGTKLVCCVYGPRDANRRLDQTTGHLNCDFTYAPFSRKKREKPNQFGFEKKNSSLLLQALYPAVCLDSFPKAQVDIYITVLEDNGSTLSHAIMAAAVALADAGIEMLDTVTACTLVFSDSGLCIDPTDAETCHDDVRGTMSVAYLPSMNQVSSCLSEGMQDVDIFRRNTDTCLEACIRVHAVIRECLVK